MPPVMAFTWFCLVVSGSVFGESEHPDAKSVRKNRHKETVKGRNSRECSIFPPVNSDISTGKLSHGPGESKSVGLIPIARIFHELFLF